MRLPIAGVRVKKTMVNQTIAEMMATTGKTAAIAPKAVATPLPPLKASQMGAILAPPMPAHYISPQTVDDLVDHHVGRLLDLFDLDPGLVQRWQGPASKQS